MQISGLTKGMDERLEREQIKISNPIKILNARLPCGVNIVRIQCPEIPLARIDVIGSLLRIDRLDVGIPLEVSLSYDDFKSEGWGISIRPTVR